MVRERDRAMPTFVFWYAAFLIGSAVGATAGSTFGNGFDLTAGLLGGMVISGWIAQQLPWNRHTAVRDSEKSWVQPEPTTTPAQGLKRIQFAAASPRVEPSDTAAAKHDTLGPFSLPKGMYEFAMRKQLEKQASSPPPFA